jgi:hypothetical protein
VRAGLASLLLSVFSFLLIAPLALANSEPALPVCCRGTGKHHCALASHRASSGAGISSSGEKCPYFPAQAATQSQQSSFLPVSERNIEIGVIQQPLLPTQSQMSFQIPFSRARQERGPPAFLS